MRRDARRSSMAGRGTGRDRIVGAEPGQRRASAVPVRPAIGRMARSDSTVGDQSRHAAESATIGGSASIGEVTDEAAAAVRVVPPGVEALALELMPQREGRLGRHRLRRAGG